MGFKKKCSFNKIDILADSVDVIIRELQHRIRFASARFQSNGVESSFDSCNAH